MKDISANFLRAFLPAAALVILGSWISNPAHDWQSWGFAFLLLAAYAWILGSQLKSAAAEALAQQRYTPFSITRLSAWHVPRLINIGWK